MNEIAAELSALMDERQKLFKQGGSTREIEQAVKNLLGSDIINMLAKRGFLPRYAFPLDVVTLETGWSRWLRDADVELSRDRGIAIAEFAPGAQVIAHKKVFTSAGLYVMSNRDKPERLWCAKCPSCEQIRTERTQEPLMGHCSIWLCRRLLCTPRQPLRSTRGEVRRPHESHVSPAIAVLHLTRWRACCVLSMAWSLVNVTYARQELVTSPYRSRRRWRDLCRR
jgi:hypothetical protein